jgi:hypothetical protein
VTEYKVITPKGPLLLGQVRPGETGRGYQLLCGTGLEGHRGSYCRNQERHEQPRRAARLLGAVTAMEERNGVRGVTADDVFFTEEEVPNAEPLKHLKVEISRQDSNLKAVKSRLAADAKAVGGTAVMNFRYGQRPHRDSSCFCRNGIPSPGMGRATPSSSRVGPARSGWAATETPFGSGPVADSTFRPSMA